MSNGKSSACPPFFRLLPNRVWRTYLGGRILDGISGKSAPADTHFPEDWLLSTTIARNPGREHLTTEGVSQVELDGEVMPLTAVIKKFPGEMLGAEHLSIYGENAAFLLKYLDSSVRLHIQCHPTVPFAQQHLNSNSGKAEGYFILGVRPECEGYIYLGFQRVPDKDEFKQAIEVQELDKVLGCFDKIPVKPGDCFYVPGGVPHAIGEGVFMIEIMEPTDFAVRIEFERGGYLLPEKARFMDRGIDFALSMFEFKERSIEQVKSDFFISPRPLPVSGNGERFALFDHRKTDRFYAEKLLVDGEMTVAHHAMRVLVVTGGSGTLTVDGKTLELSQYDRILLPCCSREITLSGTMECLMVLPAFAGDQVS